jgi:hypothetical protein
MTTKTQEQEQEQLEYFPLSPSRIVALDCGYRFHQKYVLKNRRTDEEEQARTPVGTLIGKVGHRCNELYTLACKEQKITSDQALMEKAFEDAWDEQNYLPESQYTEVKKILMDFNENNLVDPEHLFGVEIKVSLNWLLETVGWKAFDIWIRGILDKVEVYPDGTAVVTDYKFFLPSESKLKNSWQTKIYPFLMKCLNPYLNTIILRYHGIKTNKKVEFTFAVSEIGEIEDSLRALSKRTAKRIANPETVWTARLGENCPYCIYDCPLLDLGIEPIKDVDKAVVVGQKLYAMKQEADRLQAELKGYLAATDEIIDIGAGEYFMKEQYIRRGLKADKIVKLALELGIDVNQVLKPDTDKIKKLPDDDIKKAILAGTKESMQKRFTFEAHTEEDKKDNREGGE